MASGFFLSSTLLEDQGNTRFGHLALIERSRLRKTCGELLSASCWVPRTPPIRTLAPTRGGAQDRFPVRKKRCLRSQQRITRFSQVMESTMRRFAGLVEKMVTSSAEAKLRSLRRLGFTMRESEVFDSRRNVSPIFGRMLSCFG